MPNPGVAATGRLILKGRVPDSGSHRPSAPRPPHHRPPPLLVIAATGLAMVIGLGITLLIVRARGGGGGAKDEVTTIALPSSVPAPQPAVTPSAPARIPTPDHSEATAPAAAAEPPPAEVPEWERKPLRTSQPFPEEARFDPPMPPIKIPPEMLIPLAAPDAGAVR